MAIRALIVDDSSVMRKIVERSLRQAGIDLSDVFQAGNGAEALGVLKESMVDLILCYINMPVMDGLEFIKQLPAAENAKGVPVVMTTEGSEAHVVQALSAGARGYIRKPFTPEQVKEHVTPCAGRQSMKSVTELLAADGGHQDWVPLLDTAAREVVRTDAAFSAHRIAKSGGGKPGGHVHGGIGGPVVRSAERSPQRQRGRADDL
jgi:two-component system, chemotaxis family, chemotaxis protein CheY